jgi:hypothetical protein
MGGFSRSKISSFEICVFVAIFDVILHPVNILFNSLAILLDVIVVLLIFILSMAYTLRDPVCDCFAVSTMSKA